MSTHFLSVEEVQRIQKQLISTFGGLHGLKDIALLESALMRPQLGYYTTLNEQAAALMESLANNHPFLDGNKRVAFFVTDTFLRLNGYWINCDNEETYIYFMGLFKQNRFRFEELFKIKRIDAKFSEQAIFFLLYLDKYGKDRYLEQGYNAYSEQLIFLDQLVAEMRIYCRLDYETIKEIEDVRCIRIDGGTLESILDDLNHPAREALLWENAFFGEKRNTIALSSFVIAERSELIYSPEMIEKLKEYIYLPKSIVQKYSNLSRGLS